MSLNRLGLIKTSLIDYPGEVAAVIFTSGCNLRCPFCHNPGLVSGSFPADFLPREEVMAFLARRAQILGGVCITGGEPLLHNDLKELTDYIRQLGLKIKIDTNGTFPAKLEEIMPDYVALDIKTSAEKYNRLLPGRSTLQFDLFGAESKQPRDIWSQVRNSLDWIANSGVEFEVRTTVVPDLVTIDDISKITDFLADNFAEALGSGGHYVLAGFNPGNVLDPAYGSLQPYPQEVLEDMAEIAKRKGIECTVRPNTAPGTDNS